MSFFNKSSLDWFHHYDQTVAHEQEEKQIITSSNSTISMKRFEQIILGNDCNFFFLVGEYINDIFENATLPWDFQILVNVTFS